MESVEVEVLDGSYARARPNLGRSAILCCKRYKGRLITVVKAGLGKSLLRLEVAYMGNYSSLEPMDVGAWPLTWHGGFTLVDTDLRTNPKDQNRCSPSDVSRNLSKTLISISLIYQRKTSKTSRKTTFHSC